MASNIPLEDIVTCPICQELYQNPMALSCLHTLCSQCIEAIKRKQAGHTRHMIECPICREVTKTRFIKKDFKVQSWVDIYKTESENRYSGVSYKIPCRICKENEISWNCMDCDMYICHKCKTGHLEIPACQRHIVQGIEETLKRKLLNIESLHQDYAVAKETVEEYAQKVKEDYDAILDKEQQLLSNVDDKKLNLQRQIDEYCLCVKEQISEVLKDDKNTASALLHDAETLLTDLQKNADMLSSMKGKRDPQTLLLRTDNTVGSLRQDLSTVQQCIPEYQKGRHTEITLNGESSSIITRELGNWLNIQTEQEAKNLGVMCENNSMKHCNIRSWSNSDAKVMEETTIHCHDCNAIAHIGSHIWCINDKRITVYSTTGQYIKSIGSVKSGRAAVSTPKGKAIVACSGTMDDDMGLLLLDPNGNFLTRLIKGRFIDVSRSSDTIAALDYEAGDIKLCVIVEELEHKLQLQLPIQTIQPDLDLSIFDTVTISGEYLFMASFCHNQITSYTKTGDLDKCYTNESMVQTFVPLTGLGLKNPRLCLSDDLGSAVFINFGYSQSVPFILDSQGVLYTMNRPKGNQHQGHKYLHVTSDSKGNLWVLKQKSQTSILGLENYNICKYSLGKQLQHQESGRYTFKIIALFTLGVLFVLLSVLSGNSTITLAIVFIITAILVHGRLLWEYK